MEENMHTPPSSVEISSLGTRAVNVLTAPGELYAEVAAAPVQSSSWLIPYLIMMALVGVMVYAMSSNPVLFDQVTSAQREEFARQVAEGKMRQADADRAVEMMESPAVFVGLGTLGGMVFMSVIMFGAPLAFWLGSKWVLGYQGGYRKILEVYGLALVIGVVGTLVTLIMMSMMGSMYAQPSPAFLIRDTYDQGNYAHNLLASMNVFSIWQVAVTGIGLASVSGKETGRGMMVAFGLWMVYVLVASALGWGAR